MLYDRERVKRDVIDRVCEQCPEIPREDIVMIIECMDEYIEGLMIRNCYEALDTRCNHVRAS